MKGNENMRLVDEAWILWARKAMDLSTPVSELRQIVGVTQPPESENPSLNILLHRMLSYHIYSFIPQTFVIRNNSIIE